MKSILNKKSNKQCRKTVCLTLVASFVALLPSCSYYLYKNEYEGYYSSEFSIYNEAKDSSIKVRVGQLIVQLAGKEKFSKRYVYPPYDSLYFYSPDRHEFRFQIYQEYDFTKIKMRYSGQDGFRIAPPHRRFKQEVKDSIKIQFSATEKVIVDATNERK